MSTSWMMHQLKRFYSVERVTLDGRINTLRSIAIEDSVKQTIKDLGNKYDVLIVAQPTEPFDDINKYLIDQHIMRGESFVAHRCFQRFHRQLTDCSRVLRSGTPFGTEYALF